MENIFHFMELYTISFQNPFYTPDKGPHSFSAMQFQFFLVLIMVHLIANIDYFGSSYKANRAGNIIDVMIEQKFMYNLWPNQEHRM